MTDLLDRIQNPDIISPDINPISAHAFTGAVTLAVLGHVTRQAIINKWTLVGDEVVQLDAIIAVYAGKSNANQKQDYVDAIIASLLVREDGTITKAQVETILEI